MRVTWPGPSACGDPRLEHFPEKWTPVFRQGNATNIDPRALSVYGACDFMVNLNGKRSRIGFQHCVEVCDREVQLAELEIGEPAGIERPGAVGSQPQRFIAVGQSLRQLAA